MAESVPLCCIRAVYDCAAGWWCPQHGDQMQIALDEGHKITEARDG